MQYALAIVTGHIDDIIIKTHNVKAIVPDRAKATNFTIPPIIVTDFRPSLGLML